MEHRASIAELPARPRWVFSQTADLPLGPSKKRARADRRCARGVARRRRSGWQRLKARVPGGPPAASRGRRSERRERPHGLGSECLLPDALSPCHDVFRRRAGLLDGMHHRGLILRLIFKRGKAAATMRRRKGTCVPGVRFRQHFQGISRPLMSPSSENARSLPCCGG